MEKGPGGKRVPIEEALEHFLYQKGALMETEEAARERLAAMEAAVEAYMAQEVELAAEGIFPNDPELRARWIEAMDRVRNGVK